MIWQHFFRRSGRWYYRRDGLFDVEMPHSVCPSYSINLRCIQGTRSMLQLTCNILPECMCVHPCTLLVPAWTLCFVVVFLSLSSIMEISTAVLRSPAVALRIESSTGRRAPRQTRRRKGFQLAQLFDSFTMIWHLSLEWPPKSLWIKNISKCHFGMCHIQVKVNCAKASGGRYRISFSLFFIFFILCLLYVHVYVFACMFVCTCMHACT